ncbi:DNA adenine methylase [Clostridium beijerinckii]|uniref:DNA adenine methylase n=1 Tax=Clostridium beijerinckii TaxID=1520 RepID=UPI0023302D45|nr:DNA adenine methylase [Clostridium beijerinckii]
MAGYIKSPFNYTGGKYKLLDQIMPLFPERIDNFIDLFSGGCNVGINVDAHCKKFIDYNDKLIDLLNVFKNYDLNEILIEIEGTIAMYELSNTSTFGYEYYNSNSSGGLADYNREKYMNLRKYYNNIKDNYDKFHKNVILYILIIYGFNNQIRFNKKGEFNIPVGKRDFNNRIKNNLIQFINKIKSSNCEFINLNFREIEPDYYKNSFIYADPPYLITNASYNEQGGWDEDCEYELYDQLDILSSRGVKFALSNVIENKGAKNEILVKWIYSRNYNIHYIDKNYNNSNYQIKDRSKKTIEVLITNY